MADYPRSRVATSPRSDSAARSPWSVGVTHYRRENGAAVPGSGVNIPDVVCNASFGGHAERGARAMTNRNLCAAILTAAALMTATPVAAQVTTGTIVGTISDTNGVVPGASVTIREVSKNTSDTYVMDQNGRYSAPFLTPGTYAVEVQVQGFKKWVRDGVILQVNQRARVDVTLEV